MKDSKASHGILTILSSKRTLRIAGLMSGTSADGVDVAIVDITASHSPKAAARSHVPSVRVLAFETFPYRPALRKRVFGLFDAATRRVDAICHMNFVLGEVFAEAVIALARKASIPLRTIDAIGSHGQTIYHIPAGRRYGRRSIRSTLQIGEPSIIAERTGITTVADFRPRDIAAGGQGAPLVPLTDWVLFGHGRLGRAVQNIGGIANVTFLPAGGKASGILAFDTGPGNMIIDRLAQIVSRGRLNCDMNGKIAAAGGVDAKLLARLMKAPYLKLRPPKTTGRELFGAKFAENLLAVGRKAGIADADIVATATAFTAASIADAYGRFLTGRVDEVILCGGGARNPTLVAMLQQRMPKARVRTMDELGIDADAKEAVSFAILAERTLRGLPGNAPSATGAKRSAILGKIVPA